MRSQVEHEVFSETVASTTMGILSSAAVVFFLVSNPVGWDAAFFLAAVTVAAEYTAGKIAEKDNDIAGSEADYVKSAFLDRLCG